MNLNFTLEKIETQIRTRALTLVHHQGHYLPRSPINRRASSPFYPDLALSRTLQVGLIVPRRTLIHHVIPIIICVPKLK
jgi:hypothetical protein